MNIIQCKMCNRAFHRVNSNICPICLKKMDEDFITVRDYLYDNPNALMDDVSEETGVSKAIIMQLLRDGRLILNSPDGGGVLVCEVCKKPIHTGRMCKQCMASVASEVKKNVQKHKPPEPEKKEVTTKATAKMHTEDIRRK